MSEARHHETDAAAVPPDSFTSDKESAQGWRVISGGCFSLRLARARSGRPPGFTLMELIIVLAILAILLAASIPTFRSFSEDDAAHEPMDKLAGLAKQARLHAIREKRPYQIVFSEKSFTATRYLSPYLQLADLDKFVQTAQMSEDEDAAARAADPDNLAAQNGTPPPNANAFATNSGVNNNSANSAQQPQPVHPFKEWTETYNLPEGTNYSVQNWYETTPTDISGDGVKLWVFQPSGMCMPLTVHLNRGSMFFEMTFNSLTADVSKEVSGSR